MDRYLLAELRRDLDQDARNGVLWASTWTIDEGYQLLDYIAELEARVAELEERR
jgi:hypothetical protein